VKAGDVVVGTDAVVPEDEQRDDVGGAAAAAAAAAAAVVVVAVLSPSSLAPRPLSVTDPALEDPTLPPSSSSGSAATSDAEPRANGHWTHTHARAHICASELEFLDVAINVGKSARMRFGPRFKNACADIVVSGHSIEWEMSARYLGVYLESSTKFKCSFSKNKVGFKKKSFNSIFGKIGRSASEEVLFELIKSKCLPILLYGTRCLTDELS